jgi:hypothetical protein
MLLNGLFPRFLWLLNLTLELGAPDAHMVVLKKLSKTICGRNIQKNLRHLLNLMYIFKQFILDGLVHCCGCNHLAKVVHHGTDILCLNLSSGDYHRRLFVLLLSCRPRRI